MDATAFIDQLRHSRDYLCLLCFIASAIVFAAPVRCVVDDGGTSQYTRRKRREEANLLLSNPDMLRSGILPYHTRWARFWGSLETVVIDEVHAYRGIFGSN